MGRLWARPALLFVLGCPPQGSVPHQVGGGPAATDMIEQTKAKSVSTMDVSSAFHVSTFDAHPRTAQEGEPGGQSAKVETGHGSRLYSRPEGTGHLHVAVSV